MSAQRKAEVRRPGHAALAVIIAYALWCGGSYAFLLANDLRYVWHVPLHALAALCIWKPQILRPRRGNATAVHFVAVGVAYSVFIGEPLAVLGHGDLHPDLLLNSFLWLGSYAGVYLAWLWLLRRWRWPALNLFLACGAIALFEQSMLLWRLVIEGDVASFLLFLPVVHAVYASMIAPVAIAYREALATSTDTPRAAGHAWALLAPGVLFRIGSLWIVLGQMVLRQAG